MPFRLELEFEEGWDISDELLSSTDYLVQDLSDATAQAADAAVQAMQVNHPYTDRTYLLSGGMYVRPGRRSRYSAESVVEFKAIYAQAVDAGVEGRSRPYPFTPQGMAAAEAKLDVCADQAMAAWCERLGK